MSATTAWTWFAVCAVALQTWVLAYGLDRRRAPVLRAVASGPGRAPES